jgi:hypothetical protein
MNYPIHGDNMEKSMIVYLIAGILVGAGVGVGIGYVAFDDSNNDIRTEYWFYLDDGVGEGNVTGWYSGIGDSAFAGFESAMKKGGVEYEKEYSDYFKGTIITSINEKSWDEDTGAYWMLFLLEGLNVAADWVESPWGISSVVSTIFAFWYTNSTDPYEPADADWVTTGPFAALA